MLIMPSTDTNFQALAETIAEDFFTNGTPLNDGCIKTAKDNSFTPEEIKRLVEKTNTAASIRLLKTAADKKGTFNLASTETVLASTHTENSEATEKTASYNGLGAIKAQKSVDLFAAFGVTGAEKTASENESVDATRYVFSLRKSLEEKRQEKIALELSVQDKIDGLVSRYSVWNGPDFKKFAAESLAVYGHLAEPVICGIAKYLGINEQIEKIASDEVVDDRSQDMQDMRFVCDGLASLVKLGSEIDEISSALEYYWQESRKGR